METADDKNRLVVSVRAVCFFCFAMGLILASPFARLISSVQFQDWSDSILWSSLLAFLIAGLCFVVERQIRYAIRKVTLSST